MMNCRCPDGKATHKRCEVCERDVARIDELSTGQILDRCRRLAKTDATLAYIFQETWLEGCRCFAHDGRTYTQGELETWLNGEVGDGRS